MLLTWDEVAQRQDLVGGDVVVIAANSLWACSCRSRHTLVFRARIAEIAHQRGLATIKAEWVSPQVASSEEWLNRLTFEDTATVRTYTRPIASLEFPERSWYVGTSYPLTGCLLWFFPTGQFELLDPRLTAGMEVPTAASMS